MIEADYNHPAPMTLSPGTRLGSYEILSPLGAGGMGQVYRARDTRLGRDVALKTLPDSFTDDPERLARFRREAQVLASLNHPHVGAIYGLEEVNGQQVLVLELVEGETLADRIARGPIPFDDAVVLATQIAEALEAAHDTGIIHRDLKPANIALTREGVVKVLDFGLAKATDVSGAAHLDTPTLTSPALMTSQGVILGTAAYMSPEQAKGRAADKRSDVWAFGCVVYEMLTGRRPFAGEEISDTLASVLRDEPDYQALPAAARPLASVLRRLLEKDPARRLRDMRDVKLLMTDAEQPDGPVANVANVAARSRWIAGAASVGVAVGVVSAALVLSWWRGATPTPRVERFALALAATPPSTEPSGRNIAISPDGTQVVYTTGSSPGFQLVVRPIDRVEGTVITGTDRGRDPFFSVDGRQIGYATLDELRRVSVEGGSSFKICRLSVVFSGASWGPDDSIVFAQAGGLGLFRVPAAGGEPELIAAPDASKGERNYLRPTVLPDGRSVLYTVALSGGQSRIVARRLAGGGDPSTVVESGFGAEYLTSGHLLYAQDQRLMAVPFDPSTLRTTGSPVPVQEDVSTKVLAGVANVAAAGDGTVVYISGGLSRGPRHIVWVDRGGTQTRALEQALEFPRYPRLSPDGSRLAITAGPAVEGNVWVHYLGGTSRPPVRLTFENHNLFPIWFPDGKRILYLTRGRTNYLNAVAADGSSVEPETLATNGEPQVPLTWVPGTDLVLVAQVTAERRQDLELFHMTGRTWRHWLQTRFDELEARVSPDGKWVAYTSDQTGQPEVWLRSFLDAGGPLRISPDGGRDAVWSPDGRELFYRNGSRMMAVKLAPVAPVASAAPTIRLESPQQLFEGGFEPGSQRAFDVAPDGRFLMIAAGTRDSSASIVLVRNWGHQIKELVRSK
jgi:eukaryotic-like serine/threonine-protein kinase